MSQILFKKLITNRRYFKIFEITGFQVEIIISRSTLIFNNSITYSSDSISKWILSPNFAYSETFSAFNSSSNCVWRLSNSAILSAVFSFKCSSFSVVVSWKCIQKLKIFQKMLKNLHQIYLEKQVFLSREARAHKNVVKLPTKLLGFWEKKSLKKKRNFSSVFKFLEIFYPFRLTRSKEFFS